MKVYDKLIAETRHLLQDEQVRELEVGAPHVWPLLKDQEFLMRKDVAYQLGVRGKPSTCYNVPTSTEGLVSEDKIYLYGKDLNEINEDTTFTKITLMNVDEIKDPTREYQSVKRLEFARYRLIPQGYMVLSSSMENIEQVRVSKEAIQKGLTFTTVGNLIIDQYKQEYGVNHVQVIFITSDVKNIKELVHVGKQVEDVTNAMDHILKNIILDCDCCPLHPICDDIEALRELHFNVKEEKK